VNGFKLERHDPAHRVWIGKVYNKSVPRAVLGNGIMSRIEVAPASEVADVLRRDRIAPGGR
jgi:hypothetical protein